MAWNVEYVWPNADFRQIKFVAFHELLRDGWNVLARQPGHRYVILRQQIGVASDVIGLVTGIEYCGELQTLGVQVIESRPGAARIHDCGMGAASKAPD